MERLEDRRLLADVGAIAGHVWWDTNGNGLEDPGEPARVAGMLYLDLNNSGAFDSGEPLTLTNANGNYQFANLNSGSYTVRHQIGNDSALSYPAPAQSQFNIELSFGNDIPEAIREGVRQAAARWSQIIIGDLPDEGAIDDIKIDVESGQLELNILATGGPDQFRPGGGLPYHGVVTWSELALNESTARATQIALHEIAHVLGVGTLWESRNLLESQFGTSVYAGRAALAMYQFAVDSAAKGVPIQATAGDTGHGTHWADSWAAVNDQFFDIMSSELNQNVAGRFISTVTVGAIHDLGYEVDYTQADLDWPSTKDKYPARREDAPLGADGKSYTVTVDATEIEGGLDFGVKIASMVFPHGPKPVITGTISGLAFIDVNRNGRRDRKDTNLKCTIFFDMDRDGVLDKNEPRIKLTTSGSYRFTSVPEGTYKLGVKLPRGIRLATPLKPVKIMLAKLKAKLNIIGIRG
jgi:hypothetical protein